MGKFINARSFYARYPLGIDLFIGVFFAVAFYSSSPTGQFDEIIKSMVTFVLGTLAARGVRSYIYKDSTDKLLEIVHRASRDGRQVFSHLTNTTISELNTQIENIVKEHGVELYRYEVSKWVRHCFAVADENRPYFGTDLQVPSKFSELYFDYLEAHNVFELRRKNHIKSNQFIKSKRILVSSPGELDRDKRHRPVPYHSITKWHSENGVDIRFIDNVKLKNIASDLALPTSDIGYWKDQYALLFEPITGSNSQQKIKLRLIFPNDVRWENILCYIEHFDQASMLNDIQGGFSIDLAEKWEVFVGVHKRRADYSRFIEDCLNNSNLNDSADLSVLDAASGIGVEAEWLSHKFKVTANEVSPGLAAKAKSAWEAANVNPKLFSYDWREFPDCFDGTVFDAILLVGNSLGFLTDEKELRTLFEAFNKLLRTNGVFIFDERNWPNIVDAIKKEGDKINNPSYWSFNTRSDRAVYYGNDVAAIPIEYSEESKIVKFQYWTIQKQGQDILTNHLIGELDMQSFSDGYLEKLTKECGFELIRKSFQLDKVIDKENADFITYVARKS